jgi:hypothetical protein
LTQFSWIEVRRDGGAIVEAYENVYCGIFRPADSNPASHSLSQAA